MVVYENKIRWEGKKRWIMTHLWLVLLSDPFFSHHVHIQDEIYRNAGYEWGAPKGHTLEQCVQDWARLPLRFDPGSRWNYSVATDVLGRLIEVISGQSLAEFFEQRILDR